MTENTKNRIILNPCHPVMSIRLLLLFMRHLMRIYATGLMFPSIVAAQFPSTQLDRTVEENQLS
jgi:hypothetical protein